MNEALEEALFRDFPGLYRLDLRWGFQCGDGWFSLLRRLSARLEPLGVTASRVVEEFGVLRFSLDVGIFTDAQWDSARAIIDEIETESETTCVRCGAWSEFAGLCKRCGPTGIRIPWRERL